MVPYFPGTIVERKEKSPSEFLFGVFSVTKGLMLLQVKEITGLETPAIQNWVNRGWIQKPVEKRYSVDHLARIMIFNMLRGVLKFENIASIMTYINGKTNDRDDDIIPDSQLYVYICEILDKVDYETILSGEKLEDIIKETVKNYKEPYKGAFEKLVSGLSIILTYYASAIIKAKADRMFNEKNI